MTGTIREQLAALKAGPKELKQFGIWVGLVLAALGGVAFWRGMGWHPWLWGIGLGLFGWGAVWPQGLRPVYYGWMTLGLVLGNVVSRVLLTLIYGGAVMPLGWWARLTGKDFLDRKWDSTAPTYWQSRKQPKDIRRERYEKQY